MVINTLMNNASIHAGIPDAAFVAADCLFDASHPDGGEAFIAAYQQIWDETCTTLIDFDVQHAVVNDTLKVYPNDRAAVFMAAHAFMHENGITICPRLVAMILPFLH